jgi:hypothetical protein
VASQHTQNDLGQKWLLLGCYHAELPLGSQGSKSLTLTQRNENISTKQNG